jgi:hypothetical protein
MRLPFRWQTGGARHGGRHERCWDAGNAVTKALRRVEVIALFPILVLSAYAMGGPKLVLAASMVLPSLLALLALGRQPDADGLVFMAQRAQKVPPTQRIEARCSPCWNASARCMAWKARVSCSKSTPGTGRIAHRYGNRARPARRMPSDACAQRCAATIWWQTLARQFGVVLHPIAAARLGIRDAIADRLRAELAAPIVVGETSLRLTASVGHAPLGGAGRFAGMPKRPYRRHTCAAGGEVRRAGSVRSLARAGQPCGQKTRIAPDRRGPGRAGCPTPSTRGFSRRSTREPARSRASRRWRAGTIRYSGLLGPGRFLGRWKMLGAWKNLAPADQATRWRRCALGCSRVTAGSPFRSTPAIPELRNPSYAEQVAWDLDAAGIEPGRLIIEVLESVAADARDDTIMATLAALRSQGIPSIWMISGWGRPRSCRSAASACAASRSTAPSSSGSTATRTASDGRRHRLSGTHHGAGGAGRGRRNPGRGGRADAGWAAASCAGLRHRKPMPLSDTSPGSKAQLPAGDGVSTTGASRTCRSEPCGHRNRKPLVGFSVRTVPRRRQNAP